MKPSHSILQFLRLLFASLGLAVQTLAFDFRVDLNKTNLDAPPQTATGFKSGFFAREPMIHNPAAIAFDSQGRAFVGQGPQFRKPLEDTPGDSVLLLEDNDGDGTADRSKVFAHGFNSIQSLAWKGDDLWIANAPDLSVVRDLDDDDVADEYRLIYSGLGTLEHALHGLNWAPDGMLYLSKGDTPVLPTAPKAFRDLTHVPSNAPDAQPVRVYGPPDSASNPYRKTYIVPTDPHTEGGVLRCGEEGAGLEIFSRGNRNPFDIAFDDEFNWLGTDNDQDGGDKIFSPFYGAHFGHRHRWVLEWEGQGFSPTVPASGPYFHGSGSGIVYYNAPQFPPEYRNVFLIGDWLRMCVYVHRPAWKGSLLCSRDDSLEELANPGPDAALFQPTALAVGPDGALYVCSWGREYGVVWDETGTKQINEGRVYRIWHDGAPLLTPKDWNADKRNRPHSEWTVQELIEDFDSHVSCWPVDAQDELVRRGDEIRDELQKALSDPSASKQKQTWVAWTLGRLAPEDDSIDRFFSKLLEDKSLPQHSQLQAQRILAYRIDRYGSRDRLPEGIVANLMHDDPRIRFEAVQALWRVDRREAAPQLVDALRTEEDPIVFYALWGCLRDFLSIEERRALLDDANANIRLGALFGLLETDSLEGDRVVALLESEEDPRIQKWASNWMANVGHGLENSGQVIGKLIDLNQRGINYELRMNLLRALRKMELSEDEWRHLKESYYDGLPNGEIYVAERSQEAALALRVLARHERALPFLWEELNDEWAPVRQAAIESFEGLGAKGRDFLLAKLEESGKPRTPAAISALSRIALDEESWIGNTPQIKTLADAYHESSNPQLRWEAVRLLVAADLETWRDESARTLAINLARAAVADPDPRVLSFAKLLAIRLGETLVVPTREPATFENSIARFETADPERGREIFFREGGVAACYRCHRVCGEGSDFAPDLSDAGARLDTEKLIRAILEPSAEITEGFRANLIELISGESLTGVPVGETDSVLTVVESDGERIEIDKDDILDRRALETSIMPSNMAELLTPQEVADLVVWLSGRRGPGGN